MSFRLLMTLKLHGTKDRSGGAKHPPKAHRHPLFFTQADHECICLLPTSEAVPEEGSDKIINPHAVVVMHYGLLPVVQLPPCPKELEAQTGDLPRQVAESAHRIRRLL